jgi:hypothetical protein
MEFTFHWLEMHVYIPRIIHLSLSGPLIYSVTFAAVVARIIKKAGWFDA